MKVINHFLILLIKFYKYFISPYFPSNCRYLPTCSEYFIDSLKLHGVFKGLFLGIKRILKNKRISNKYFTIYFSRNAGDSNKYLNISFVAKKKIGNAVERNKIKRKLKSAVQKNLDNKRLIDLNYTYVIFGKNNVYKDKFKLILDEVCKTFKKINQMDSYT